MTKSHPNGVDVQQEETAMNRITKLTMVSGILVGILGTGAAMAATALPPLPKMAQSSIGRQEFRCSHGDPWSCRTTSSQSAAADHACSESEYGRAAKRPFHGCARHTV